MIGTKVFSTMYQLTESLLKSHALRMQQAFAKSEEGKLNVSISFAIVPGKDVDEYGVDAQIQYTMEKVKEKISANVTENQTELPLEGVVMTYKLKK
jgi:uncharacterized NAD-dependent epimerase/dehydratase family protein